MKKFKVISYHKNNALMPTNGGTLVITETEYIVKYLFKTVAKYKIDNTTASKISFVSKGINLNDGDKQIDLYFFSKTAQKVYEFLYHKWSRMGYVAGHAVWVNAFFSKSTLLR